MGTFVNSILKNFIPFQGDPGTPSENRTTKVDPMLARYAALEGERRGYDRELPVAMMGAETTFGRRKHGPGNPLSYGWNSEREEFEAVNNSKHNKQLLETLAAFEDQGMPSNQVKDISDYLYLKGVRPLTNIDKGLEKLEEKKQELIDRGVNVTPRTLSWYYQGTGIPNKIEVPEGKAYGKPVEKSSPSKGHASVVSSILRALQSPESELGEYIRSIE